MNIVDRYYILRLDMENIISESYLSSRPTASKCSICRFHIRQDREYNYQCKDKDTIPTHLFVTN